jgi:RNA-directed DNA polymerase
MTWQEYGDELEERLVDLHGRIHRGAYHAKPSRRVWIPKADGRKRPWGIAALEDKVVQAAVVQVLNQIGEELSGFFVRVPAGAQAAGVPAGFGEH